MDLDFWDCYGSNNLCLIIKEIWFMYFSIPNVGQFESRPLLEKLPVVKGLMQMIGFHFRHMIMAYDGHYGNGNVSLCYLSNLSITGN